MMEMFEVPLILFLTIVAPIWIIAHYVTRWRMAELVAAGTDGGFDLTWLLVGGGIVTASGAAFAARKRSDA
jgi:hypothetical protein